MHHNQRTALAQFRRARSRHLLRPNICVNDLSISVMVRVRGVLLLPAVVVVVVFRVWRRRRMGDWSGWGLVVRVFDG